MSEEDEPFTEIVVPVRMVDGELVMGQSVASVPASHPVVAADYSRKGEGTERDVAAYAICVMDARRQHSLQHRFAGAIHRVAPDADPKSEVHVTDLIAPHKRAKTAFAHLETAEIRSFLTNLSGRLAPIVLTASASASVPPDLSVPQYRRFARLLFDRALSVAQESLREYGWSLGDVEIMIARGDEFDFRAVLRTLDENFNVHSEPTFALVQARDERLVQVADIAAYLATSLVQDQERQYGETLGPWYEALRLRGRYFEIGSHLYL